MRLEGEKIDPNTPKTKVGQNNKLIENEKT